MKNLRLETAFVALVIVFCGFQTLQAQHVQKFEGELKKGAEKATHKVKLEADKEYLIDMTSKSFDTYLRLLDAAGKELAKNDDGAGYGLLNARLGFVPKKTEEYQIEATSFRGTGSGKYVIQVNTIAKTGQAEVKKGKISDKSPKEAKKFPFETFKVPLDKGKLYKIDLEAKGFDPVLSIYEDEGNLVSTDLDGGDGKNARLYFMPQEKKDYEIRVKVQFSKATKGKMAEGDFTLTIQPYEIGKKEVKEKKPNSDK